MAEAVRWYDKAAEQGSPEAREARGAAMLDAFASEFMPRTNERYKQVQEKLASQSKVLSDLEKSIRANGGDPKENDTYKSVNANVLDVNSQVNHIRDVLFGNYCYHKMEVFGSDELRKRDVQAVAEFETKYQKK